QGDQRPDVERPEDQRQLPVPVEPEFRDVVEPEFEPRPPDKELQEHHYGKPHAVVGHAASGSTRGALGVVLPMKVRKRPPLCNYEKPATAPGAKRPRHHDTSLPRRELIHARRILRPGLRNPPRHLSPLDALAGRGA